MNKIVSFVKSTIALLVNSDDYSVKGRTSNETVIIEVTLPTKEVERITGDNEVVQALKTILSDVANRKDEVIVIEFRKSENPKMGKVLFVI